MNYSILLLILFAIIYFFTMKKLNSKIKEFKELYDEALEELSKRQKTINEIAKSCKNKKSIKVEEICNIILKNN